MPNVIFDYFTLSYSDLIIRELQDQLDWKPCLILSGKSKYMSEKFPNSDVIDYFEARRGYYEFNFKNELPVDLELLQKLSKYETVFYDILERSDPTGHNFSWRQRKNLFYRQILFWYNYILENNIDLVVSWVIPHGTDSYPLYALAKVLNKKQLILDNSPIFGKYNYCYTSIEDKSSVLSTDTKCSSTEIDQDILNYLNNLKKEYGKCLPSYMKKKWGKGDYDRFIDIIKEFIYLLKRNCLLKPSRQKFKSNYKEYDLKNTDFSNFRNFIYKNSNFLRNHLLKRFYNSHCAEYKSDKKYIYFSASYQPEATTCPAADRYNDQILVLKMLSQAIPDDFTIYYKEHPATFWWFVESHLSRNKDYYIQIKSIPKVHLISTSTDTFQLIDNSAAVACLSGTVIIEAIVRGRPAISFGSSWYDACSEIFKVLDYKSLCEVVNKILNGFSPNFENILKFASVVQHVGSCKTHLYEFEKNVANKTFKKSNIEYLVEILNRTYKNFCN